jgi:antirestriction protein ArdC
MQHKPDRINVYQTVTDRIIASLEKGAIPWEKPWKTPKLCRRDLSTQLPYRQAIPRRQHHAAVGIRL